VGPRPTAIDGAVLSGEGNGGRGNRRGGEGRGWGSNAVSGGVEGRGR
jgi:hypothetical protein